MIFIYVAVYDWSRLRNDQLKCPVGYCHNDGVCLVGGEGGVSGHTCLCKPGFTGPTCLTAYSTCSEEPCLHGAPCTEDPSGGTGYICNCAGTGFGGRHCELEINNCSANSCSNGGTCLPQPGGGGFLCECRSPNFTGMRCDNEIVGTPGTAQVKHTSIIFEEYV